MLILGLLKRVKFTLKVLRVVPLPPAQRFLLVLDNILKFVLLLFKYCKRSCKHEGETWQLHLSQFILTL